MFLAGQILGAVGIGINFVIFQQTDKKKLVFIKLISDIVWAIHYGLIGAYSGMIVAVTCIPREIVFFNRGKKFTDNPLWCVLFGTVNILAAIFTWKNLFSIFPAVASVIAMVAFWLKNIKTTKLLSLAVSGLMATYDIVSDSYMGIANEVITLISILSSLVRWHKTREKEEQKQKS